MSKSRLHYFIAAVMTELRKVEHTVEVDRETGEITHAYWNPGQRAHLYVEHSTDCASRKHGADEGFICACSPEIWVELDIASN